jgi:hypothetical protein
MFTLVPGVPPAVARGHRWCAITSRYVSTCSGFTPFSVYAKLPVSESVKAKVPVPTSLVTIWRIERVERRRRPRGAVELAGPRVRGGGLLAARHDDPHAAAVGVVGEPGWAKEDIALVRDVDAPSAFGCGGRAPPRPCTLSGGGRGRCWPVSPAKFGRAVDRRAPVAIQREPAVGGQRRVA